MAKQETGKSLKARHDLRKKRRRLQLKIRRYTFLAILALIAVLVVIYFTPLFNIKATSINGNERLATETVSDKIGKIEGKNLFALNKGGLKRRLKEIPYIDSVSISKKIIPPTVIITIKEAIPKIQVVTGSGYTLFDKDGKALENVAESVEGIPIFDGLSIMAPKPGSEIEFKDEETKEIVMSCISNMEKAGILSDTTTMSFQDMTNITFNYQNRLDVICGTHIDFQRKLALFKEAINSNKLTENSRGTINLSTTGKAIYTPKTK